MLEMFRKGYATGEYCHDEEILATQFDSNSGSDLQDLAFDRVSEMYVARAVPFLSHLHLARRNRFRYYEQEDYVRPHGRGRSCLWGVRAQLQLTAAVHEPAQQVCPERSGGVHGRVSGSCGTGWWDGLAGRKLWVVFFSAFSEDHRNSYSERRSLANFALYANRSTQQFSKLPGDRQAQSRSLVLGV